MSLETRIGDAVQRLAAGATRRAAGLHTRQVDAGGVRFTYDEGNPSAARTILMLHGFTGDRDNFTRFAAAFGEDHVLVPDHAGHGATGWSAGANYSAPRQAERILAFLDAVGAGPVHVVGNSMGGFIAAWLTLQAPERVRSLALIDAAGVDSPQPSTVDTMIESGPRNPFLIEEPGQFDEFFALTMHKPPVVPGFVRRSIAHRYVERLAAHTEIFGDFRGKDLLTDRLGEITAPAWVAWGRHDQLIHVAAAQVWADGIPNATLKIYEDLGHLPMLEAPRRVAADYRAFLDGVEA